MSFGGFRPSPERTGGAKPIFQIVLESINAQMGTAYDTDSQTSPVFMRNLALARCICDVINAGEKMKNQFDPDRMSEFIPRWEAIMGIVSGPTDTQMARKRRIKARFARIGRQPTRQAILDLLTEEMAPITVYLTNDTPETANFGWPYTMGRVYSLGTTPPAVTVSGDPDGTELLRIIIPVGGILGVAEFQYSLDGGDTYNGVNILTTATFPIPGTPLTIEFPAGTYNTDNIYYSQAYGDADWFSSIALFSIQGTAPDGMTDEEYYSRIGSAWNVLDSYAPVWADFNFTRDSEFGAGFYLDTEHNLDNQRFSE